MGKGFRINKKKFIVFILNTYYCTTNGISYMRNSPPKATTVVKRSAGRPTKETVIRNLSLPVELNNYYETHFLKYGFTSAQNFMVVALANFKNRNTDELLIIKSKSK